MENMTPVQKRETATQEVERTHNYPTIVPATDIYTKEKVVVLVADMPGVDEENVNIRIEKGVLTITGVAKQVAIEGYRLLYAEYEPHVYERSFSVSDEIDTEKIEAKMQNGVLTVTLPLSEKSKPKTITVKVQK